MLANIDDGNRVHRTRSHLENSNHGSKFSYIAPNSTRNDNGGTPATTNLCQPNQQSPIKTTPMEYEEHNPKVSGNGEEASAQDKQTSNDDGYVEVTSRGETRHMKKKPANAFTIEG